MKPKWWVEDNRIHVQWENHHFQSVVMIGASQHEIEFWIADFTNEIHYHMRVAYWVGQSQGLFEVKV